MSGKYGRWKYIAGTLVAVFAIAIAVVSVSVRPISPGDLASNSQASSQAGESVSSDQAESASQDTVGASAPDPVRVSSEDGTVTISGEFESDVVLVQFGQGADAAQLTQAIAGLACIDDAAVTDDDIAAGFMEFPVAAGYNVADAIASLDKVDYIISPQPNYIYHLVDQVAITDPDEGAALITSSINSDVLNGTALLDVLEDVNDPDGKQTAPSDRSWHLNSINAYDAWAMVKGQNLTGGARVTVAVVDTGYDTDHEDLTAKASSGIGGNVIAAYDATANREENYNSGVGDISGHGTHVAGIVAAIANNETGTAGVSYNANILPIQVFHEYEDKDGQTQDGASSISLYYAYKYIIENAEKYNIKVANLSLGAAQTDLDTYDTLVVNAIESAYRSGVLTVCAAGNYASSGAYIDFPCDFLTHGIGVIWLNKDRTRNSSSNYNIDSVNQTKDLAAPGTYIYSTTSDGSYGTKSGTSMASPVVAGVAALVFSANPSLTASDVVDVLHSTALDLTPTNSGSETSAGFDQYTGYGEVDAKAAVEGAGAYLSGDSTLLVGGNMVLSPTVSAPSGSWTWTSDTPGVATVSGGTVTGVAGGTATITAESGGTSITKKITVYDISYAIAESGVAVDDLEVVDEIELEAGTTLDLWFKENPDTGLWYISSSDTSVMTVSIPASDDLRITAVAAGEAYVTATLKENTNLVVRCKVTVCDAATKRSLQSSRAAVYWTFADYLFRRTTGAPSDSYYTGSTITPAPYLVTYTLGNGSSKSAVALSQGSDYQVSYENNENAGTATVAITGIGSYEDSVSAEFSIVSTPLNKTSVSGLSNVSYTGSPLTPIPTLTLSLNGAYTLVPNTDFVVDSYSNNTEVSANTSTGYATMTVTGKDNFTGTYNLRFTIARASLANATVKATDWTYDGKVHDPSVSLAYNGANLSQGGNWTYTVTQNGSPVSTDSVLAAGTYTVTVTGEGNYTGTASTTFTVVPKSVSGATVKLATSSLYTYDGNAKTPAVSSVTLSDGTVLGSGDYTVSYSNNVDAGTATVTVTGKGNYTGTSEQAEYAIKPKSATITANSKSKTYDGTPLTAASAGYTASGFVKSSDLVSVTLSGSATSVGSAEAIVQSFQLANPANYTVTTEKGTLTVSAARQTMYRLYNPNSGEHFYTASAAERDAVVGAGWHYEGEAWVAPSFSYTPVYRLYNPNAGDHHYTTSAPERDHLVGVGWNDEGTGWYSDDARAVVLYRLYNPNAVAGAHHYTTSASERDHLVGVGWNDEGTAWYGMTALL